MKTKRLVLKAFTCSPPNFSFGSANLSNQFIYNVIPDPLTFLLQHVIHPKKYKSCLQLNPDLRTREYSNSNQILDNIYQTKKKKKNSHMGGDVIKTRTSRELGTLRRMIIVAFVLLFRFLLWDQCIELH